MSAAAVTAAALLIIAAIVLLMVHGPGPGSRLERQVRMARLEDAAARAARRDDGSTP